MNKNQIVRNGKQVNRVLDRNGIFHRHCDGSHCVATLPNGEKLTYHDHHEYGIGIATKITKILLRAGLVLLFLMTLLQILIFLG